MKSQFLSVGLKAVKEAEAVILRYLGQNLEEQLKDDLSPVTKADIQAEEAIKKCILAEFPDHSFYGEEGDKADLSNHTGYTWIIDPIDGTKSYMRKNPLFATQLALMKDGELIIGISNAPLLKELVYAEKDQGCFLNDSPLNVSKVEDIKEAYVSFGSLKYFAKHSNLESLTTLVSQTKWARGIGDFWSYHLLAQGKIDVMIEADTKIWDVAAMKVIVEEAGGKLTQIDGQELTARSTSVIASNGLLHQPAVTIFISH